MSAPTAAPPASPPGQRRPPRPGAARAAVAGLLAIVVVVGGVVLVNVLHPHRKAGAVAAGARTSSPAATQLAAPAPGTSTAPPPTVASSAPKPTTAASTTAGPARAAAKAPVVILNDSKVTKLAVQAASMVQAAGFAVVRTGSWGGGVGSDSNIARTTVFYEGDALAPAARALASAISGVDEVREIKPGAFPRPAGEDGDLLLVVTKYFPSASPRP